MKFRFICYTDAMIRLQGDNVLFFNLLKKFSESYVEYIKRIEFLINNSDYMEAYEVAIESYLVKFKREFQYVLDEIKEYLSVGGDL